jgi:glutaredoxin 2
MKSNVKLNQYRIVFQHLKNLATHHKSWNQAVKDHIVVFALLRQLDPIIHGLGCLQDRLDFQF